MPIDPHSHVPMYDQIIRHVRGAIAAGVHKTGEMVSSVRVLALELGINPNTVQRAYREMEREGLLESRRGLGLFVAARVQRSAQQRALETVRDSFSSGVALGLQADIGIDRIQNAFDQTLREAMKGSRAGGGPS